MGVPWADQKSKTSSFWSDFSYVIQQRTISLSDWDAWWKLDCIRQPAMTSSVTGLTGSSRELPKAELAPKKGHSHYLVVSHPLQLSESQWDHYTREVCSANQWDALKTTTPAASIGQQKGPNSFPWQRPTAHHTTNASKVGQIGLQSLPSSATFTWPLVNRLPLLQASQQLFVEKTFPQPTGCRKCFPRVHWIPKHGFLCYRDKQIYISLVKMCWL